jgi:hypothetical protein
LVRRPPARNLSAKKSHIPGGQARSSQRLRSVSRRMLSAVPRVFRGVPFRALPQAFVILHNASLVPVSALVPSHNPIHRPSESHPALLRAGAEQPHHSSAAQCRIRSLAHHLIPSISSSSMHCRCHSRTVFSLLHLPSLPVWRPLLFHTPHSHRACACSLCLSVGISPLRFVGWPLIRTSRAVPVGSAHLSSNTVLADSVQ